ncbi:MAG: hypothetical protein U0167_06295 [bacterium]
MSRERARRRRVVCVTASQFLWALWIVSAAGALEKRHVIAPEDPRGWAVGSTEVTVSYYNVCTDWAWSWDLGPLARFGTVFECPAGEWNLTGVSCTFDGSTIPGYGFTGVLAVSAVDAQGCPVGTPLASQPFLPVDGVVTYSFDVRVPSSFVVVGNVGNGYPNGAYFGRFVSDHPAHGPTGPAACGTCYPETRSTHSFYYGSDFVALCPGTPFFDGLCNAELMWIAHLTGTATAAPEPEVHTWAAIKALYR